MRITRYAVPALVLSLCAQAATAETGLYLGASLGHSEVGFQDADFDNFDVDDSDTGYKLYGGFQFTMLAVEGSYRDFGTIGGDEGEVDLSGMDVFGKLSFGLGPVEVFGKLGGFLWDADLDNFQDKREEDGFDPVLGLGAAFNLGGMGLRAEYEYFDIDDFDSVSMLSVGATFWLL